MSEVEWYEGELKQRIAGIKNDVSNLSSKKGKERNTAARKVEESIERAKSEMRAFELEVRDLDGDQRKTYRNKLKQFRQELKSLTNELQWSKEADREELLGPDHTQQQRSKPTNTNEMTPDQMTKRALEVQDESLASVERSKQTVARTEEVGSATAERLKGQTEKLEGINQDLDTLEGEIKRARREVRSFARRVATDKVILIVFAILCVAIAAAIVFAVVNKVVDIGGSGNDNASGTGGNTS